MKQESGKNKLRVYIPLAIVIIAVIVGAWYWYKDYSSYITTDDAHVDAGTVGITSKILGRIVAVHADEGTAVTRGTLLAELDSTDLLAQKSQALALRAQAEANQSQAQVKYNSDEKSIRVLEINLERATEDFARAKNQSAGGVISAEQFDHAGKAYETAVAQLDAARAQLKVSRSMISSSAAAVETASAQVKVLETQIRNARLFAPADGMIARRWLNPGDVVQPGQSILTLINNKDLCIEAYLEETKVSEIFSGQQVKFSIDAFPGVTFRGKVILIGSSTASVFSLIPASNASGNFTKVTQRIPVKISIESAGEKGELSGFNILSGMSAVVKIIRGR
ncbi:MAG: HlyD family secretion protein [Bacteroidales bacterium]